MMTENVDKQQIENDELICPITLQLFDDPVKAKDGHVYEREAITRWILQHGTSPLTRQPLQINDLQPDHHLRDLAKQRRNSTVSYKRENDTVTLPPLRRIPRNFHRIAPADILNPVGINRPSNKRRCRMITGFIVFVVIPTSVIIAIVLATKNFQAGITSVYNGVLTTNSSRFNRLTPSISGAYYYDSIKIVISKDGYYEFESESSIDMYAYFYQNSFNSTDKNLNLLTFDDDHGRNYQFYFKISLTSSNTYILVATTYYNTTTGSFSVYVTGPSTVTFNVF